MGAICSGDSYSSYSVERGPLDVAFAALVGPPREVEVEVDCEGEGEGDGDGDDEVEGENEDEGEGRLLLCNAKAARHTDANKT